MDVSKIKENEERPLTPEEARARQDELIREVNRRRPRVCKKDAELLASLQLTLFTSFLGGALVGGATVPVMSRKVSKSLGNFVFGSKTLTVATMGLTGGLTGAAGGMYFGMRKIAQEDTPFGRETRKVMGFQDHENEQTNGE